MWAVSSLAGEIPNCHLFLPNETQEKRAHITTKLRNEVSCPTVSCGFVNKHLAIWAVD